MSVQDSYINKRNGQIQKVSKEKLRARILPLMGNIDTKYVSVENLVDEITKNLPNRITYIGMDQLIAEMAAYSITKHPDYGLLGGRIAISSLHKNTSDDLLETYNSLYNYINKKTGKRSPLISDEVFEVIKNNRYLLNRAMRYDRDFSYDFFGYKTLEKSYLLKIEKDSVISVVERPQHMWMRVAIGICGDNIEEILKTYEIFSLGIYTHATPTLFNAGTPKPQMSSCFLVSMNDDSIQGIYKTLGDCAEISKTAGGIGLHIHNIRSTGSFIAGTNGISNGIVPMLRVFDATAKYVDQCLKEGTIIYTAKGPMKIEDIQTDITQVVTHAKSTPANKRNDMAIVEKLLKYPFDGKIFKIQTVLGDPMYITGQHPVLVYRNTTGDTESMLKKRFEKTQYNLEWVNAEDLTSTDYVIHKRPEFTENEMCLDDKDIRFYAMMKFYQRDHFYEKESLKIKFEQDEQIGFFTSYMIGRKISYEAISDHVNNAYNFYFKKNHQESSTDEGFYLDSDKNRVHRCVMNLPLMSVREFLLVAIDSGYYEKNNLIITNESKTFLQDVKFLFLRCGIMARFGDSGKRTYVRGDEKKTIDYHTLIIPKTTSLYKNFGVPATSNIIDIRDDTRLFIADRITTVTAEDYTGYVYDLKLDRIHDYMTQTGIVHNGGGKRKGAFAIYLEPWHADIVDFLQLKKPIGSGEMRARDLFYGLWIPDLFMKRVKENAIWTLFDPHSCPGLSDCYGDEFGKLYEQYEKEGKGFKQMKAQDLWSLITEMQIETGTPYMLYKDACNKKSNQQNRGTIKSSNLCTEIIEYSSPEETAVCNLASICLPKFLDDKNDIDHQKLFEMTRIVTRNLNRVIDRNYYPIESAKLSNMKNRPVGIGIQGLADVFMKMRIPFTSEKAKKINEEIFETIYYGACFESVDLARKEGPYPTFEGSPASKGLFQFDLWNQKPGDRWQWEELRSEMIKNGLRNSLLVAPMPTASTSQIFGNTECFEPITSNVYLRRVLAGEFPVINRYLVNHLIELGMWNEETRNDIIANDGSVQKLQISNHVKEIYKTVWELKMRDIIDMAASRGKYIDQSQSLNLFLSKPTLGQITAMHFYSWEKGLKTGMYYLRSNPVATAIKFTVEKESPVEPLECQSCGS